MKASLNEAREYWVIVDLEEGDYEKIESSDEIMANCEELEEFRYSSESFEIEQYAKNLIKLIEAL
jgi:hypothetical protein